jgi:hypothetical protein
MGSVNTLTGVTAASRLLLVRGPRLVRPPAGLFFRPVAWLFFRPVAWLFFRPVAGRLFCRPATEPLFFGLAADPPSACRSARDRAIAAASFCGDVVRPGPRRLYEPAGSDQSSAVSARTCAASRQCFSAVRT